MSERKPNKIRPKLKAEAKVKTWSWCEDEDAVPMEWPGSKAKPVEPVNTSPALPSQTCWTKKSEVKVRHRKKMVVNLYVRIFIQTVLLERTIHAVNVVIKEPGTTNKIWMCSVVKSWNSAVSIATRHGLDDQ
jgi:hypothetical protein